MKPPPIIQTRRLRLVRPQIQNAGEIFATYAQDPVVTRYLTWRPHRSIRETLRHRKNSDRAWEKGTSYEWLIRRRSDDALVGAIALRPAGFKAEIGYGQPMGTTFGGESNIRQFVIGRETIRKALGYQMLTFLEEEEFTHPQVPQIIAGAHSSMRPWNLER